MATLKKLDWKAIIHQMIAKKNTIEAHYDKGLPPTGLKHVKFIAPLQLPDNG